jgi:Spy/CpxP family protein refolding chaperone
MARSTPLPLALVALFTIVSGAAGCSGCDKPGDGAADAAPSSSATPASTSATVVATEAGAPDAGATADEPGRRGMRRGGPSTQLFQAARELTLTPEQTTKVDAAEKLGAPASDTAAKDAAKELHAELTGGIKAGKIDTAKLEPKYAALEKVASAEHDKEVESLNALYVALDATQRKAVSAAVRAKAAKRDERMAHTDAGGPDGGKPGGGMRSIDRMVRGLELDADQQKKIDAITTKESPRFDPAEMKKRMETLLAAFEKDGFDAKKADGFDAKRSRVALEEQTKVLGQVLPILKPEQREKLATKMEKGPSPHGARRPGHRPPSQDEAENDDDFLP